MERLGAMFQAGVAELTDEYEKVSGSQPATPATAQPAAQTPDASSVTSRLGGWISSGAEALDSGLGKLDSGLGAGMEQAAGALKASPMRPGYLISAPDRAGFCLLQMPPGVCARHRAPL